MAKVYACLYMYRATGQGKNTPLVHNFEVKNVGSLYLIIVSFNLIYVCYELYTLTI